MSSVQSISLAFFGGFSALFANSRWTCPGRYKVLLLTSVLIIVFHRSRIIDVAVYDCALLLLPLRF